MGDKVNNWKAAEELQRFKVRVLDPQKERVEEARKILNDPNYKWRKGEKEASKNKFALLEAKDIDNHRIYSACMELITQHEDLTDMLTEIYITWYDMISTDGLQPLEIMKMQQQIIQDIWRKIYAAIQPVISEEITKPPKQIEKL